MEWFNRIMLSSEETKKILSFVKKEPRTVQDIAKCINKTWVTADSYVEKIKKQTGQINTKVFRKDTKGSVKVVYWNYEESVEYEEVKRTLYDRIRLGKDETDFDPMEIYQHIPDKMKKAMLEMYKDPTVSTKQGIIRFLEQTEQELYCFSGNITWMNVKEGNIPVMRVIEGLLKRKVNIRIIGRVDFAAMENINRIAKLIEKYPEQIEIRHVVHPLRGFIVDGRVVRLKDEKQTTGDLRGKTKQQIRVFYEFSDPEWVYWMQQVFWNLFRGAPTAEKRIREMKRIV